MKFSIIIPSYNQEKFIKKTLTIGDFANFKDPKAAKSSILMTNRSKIASDFHFG